MASQSSLLTTTLVIHIDPKELYREDAKLLEQFWDRIEIEVRRIADEMGLEIDHYSNGIYGLGGGIKQDNSGRCVVCNTWTSAQNKPNIIRGLSIGAEYEGALYCMHDLPEASDMFATIFPFGKDMENLPPIETTDSDNSDSIR